MSTEAIQQQESCSVKESRCLTTAFEDKAVVKDLHEDEVVILDSELVSGSLVSDMKNIYLFVVLFFFYRHF